MRSLALFTVLLLVVVTLSSSFVLTSAHGEHRQRSYRKGAIELTRAVVAGGSGCDEAYVAACRDNSFPEPGTARFDSYTKKEFCADSRKYFHCLKAGCANSDIKELKQLVVMVAKEIHLVCTKE